MKLSFPPPFVQCEWQQKERKKGISTSWGHPPPDKKVLHKVGMKKSTCICTISNTFRIPTQKSMFQVLKNKAVRNTS